MIVKIIPALLVLIPLAGFFYTPEPPPDEKSLNPLIYFLFSIPWWGKAISILVGSGWLFAEFAPSNDSKDNKSSD